MAIIAFSFPIVILLFGCRSGNRRFCVRLSAPFTHSPLILITNRPTLNFSFLIYQNLFKVNKKLNWIKFCFNFTALYLKIHIFALLWIEKVPGFSPPVTGSKTKSIIKFLHRLSRLRPARIRQSFSRYGYFLTLPSQSSPLRRRGGRQIRCRARKRVGFRFRLFP